MRRVETARKMRGLPVTEELWALILEMLYVTILATEDLDVAPRFLEYLWASLVKQLNHIC